MGMASLLAVTVPTMYTPAFASQEQATAQALDIPAGPLDKTLFAIARRYEIDLLAPRDLVKGKQAHKVERALTFADAVAQALEGSGLDVSRRPGGQYLVVRRENVSGKPANENDAPPPDSDSDGDFAEEIIVLGIISETEGAIRIGGEEIQRNLATTIDELFRNTAAVEAIQGPGRQFFDFNLRGTEGANSVVISIDGAEKNLVTTKHGTTFNPVFIVPEFLKQVTLIRGPVSNTFGTGSIGGRVQFETIDPNDFVDGGNDFGGMFAAGAESNGNGYYGSFAGAASVNDTISILGGVSYREYDSYEDGGGEEVLNSGNETLAVLGKVQWQPSTNVDVEATYQRAEFNYIGSNIFAQSNIRQDADFENDVVDNSLSLAVDYKVESIKGLIFHADTFYTDTKHVETLLENRRGAGGDPGEFDARDIKSIGGKAYAGYRFNAAGMSHDLYVGASGVKDDLEFVGDSSDVSGTRASYGFFVQDRVKIGDYITLIPGLRYELFDLKRDNGPGSEGDFFLPKITAAVSPLGRDSGLELVGSFSKGLTAPRLSNLTVDLTTERTRRGSTTVNVILASDNIQAELSNSYELALRYRGALFGGDFLRASVGVFRNDFSNRIENVILDSRTEGNVTTITQQLQNIGEARIEGIEVDFRYDAGTYFAGGQFSASDGERKDTDVPLNSVRPVRGSLFLGVRLLDQKLELGTEMESFGSQTEFGENQNVVGDSSEGATIFNLFGAYRFSSRTALTTRINNVTDRLYRRFDQIDNSIGLNARLALNIVF
ncbi:TonB-dependent heme/hemoglobin receptor [Eilatimonas milleporae]|uniref:TonB-dependent heme/hemoglobin receptor n=2 Tax=Eilatimonas milleporae TaxID=911205 RepID=A0A3M0CWV4_9PROT|nr:TonB-dependent heme/hemoglobin receptor [Eilatimonas milleporae]